MSDAERELAGPGEVLLEAREARIRVDQERVEAIVQAADHAALIGVVGKALVAGLAQDVADRADQLEPRIRGARRVDQGVDLRLELPFAEGVVLDEEHVGRDLGRRAPEDRGAGLQHRLEVAGAIQRLDPPRAALDRRELDPLEGAAVVRARHRPPALYEGDPMVLRESARDLADPHVVPHAGEMLRVDEDALAAPHGRAPGSRAASSSRAISARSGL